MTSRDHISNATGGVIVSICNITNTACHYRRKHRTRRFCNHVISPLSARHPPKEKEFHLDPEEVDSEYHHTVREYLWASRHQQRRAGLREDRPGEALPVARECHPSPPRPGLPLLPSGLQPARRHRSLTFLPTEGACGGGGGGAGGGSLNRLVIEAPHNPPRVCVTFSYERANLEAQAQRSPDSARLNAIRSQGRQRLRCHLTR